MHPHSVHTHKRVHTQRPLNFHCPCTSHSPQKSSPRKPESGKGLGQGLWHRCPTLSQQVPRAFGVSHHLAKNVLVDNEGWLVISSWIPSVWPLCLGNMTHLSIQTIRLICPHLLCCQMEFPKWGSSPVHPPLTKKRQEQSLLVCCPVQNIKLWKAFTSRQMQGPKGDPKGFQRLQGSLQTHRPGRTA